MLASLLVSPFFGHGHAYASGNTYYVATNGSDSGQGTLASPWATIQKGLLALHAGDTLYVRGGTYVQNVGGSGFLGVSPATATAPVTVKAYPGERPVVKGLFHVSGMNYWTFDGINVTWNDANSTSLHMVRFKNGIGWTFKNAEVWGAKSFAAVNVLSSVSGQPANWTIADNCIHDTYGDPAHGTAKDQLLYVNTGVSAGPGLIERNLLFNAPRGKAVKLAGPVSGTGSAFVTVRYNTIDNSNKPGVVVGWATHDSSVYRNLVVKTNDVSLIRGYQLTGANNKAWDNYGYQGPALVSSDSGYPQTLHDMGGEVFPRNPTFDNTTCSGFHPQDTMAQAYGRYAP